MLETHSPLSSQPSLPHEQGNDAGDAPVQPRQASSSTHEAPSALSELPDSPVRRSDSSSRASSVRRHASLPPPPDADIVEGELISPAASVLMGETQGNSPAQTSSQLNIAAKIGELKASVAQIAASLNVLIPYHGKVKSLVASLGSPAALTRGQRDEIARLEEEIQGGQIIEAELKRLLRTLAMPPSSAKKAREADAPASRDQPTFAKRAVGMGIAGGGVLMKNISWNLPALAINVRPGDPVTARVLGDLTGMGYGGALATEYPLWTVGLDMLMRAGVKPNHIAGGAQVWDQVTAAGTLMVGNRFSGEALPKGYQALGFAGAAVGGLFSAGVLNRLLGIKDDRFSPIEALRDDSGGSAMTGGATGSPIEGDEGMDRGNDASSRSDETRAKMQALLDRKPAAALEQIGHQAAHVVDDVLPALAESILSVPGMHRDSDVEAQAASPAQAIRRPGEAAIESIKTDIGEIAAALGRWSELIQSGADKQQAQELRSTLREMATWVNGSNANATIFAAGSASLYVLGLIVATVGLVKGESAGRLGDKNVVAVTYALTSTIAQAYANWARVMGGARPDDSAFVKLLKGGLDERGSPMLEFWKNMARAAPSLALEFFPLEAGQASAHSAGPSGVPSLYTIRALQEALRAVMSQALLTAFGSRAGVPQVVGVMINVLVASAVVIMEREFNRG